MERPAAGSHQGCMSMNRISRRCVLAALAAGVSPDASSAVRNDNWPQWRGPNAAGLAGSTRLPTRWSETENVRWSVKLSGWGTSSPVVYGDRLFVTFQFEQSRKKSLQTLCLD